MHVSRVSRVGAIRMPQYAIMTKLSEVLLTQLDRDKQRSNMAYCNHSRSIKRSLAETGLGNRRKQVSQAWKLRSLLVSSSAVLRIINFRWVKAIPGNSAAMLDHGKSLFPKKFDGDRHPDIHRRVLNYVVNQCMVTRLAFVRRRRR